MYKVDQENKFSLRFNDLIKAQGLSVIQVAENTGISKSSLYDYLAGRHTPLSNHIVILSRYFGVTTNWLMGETDGENINDNRSIIKLVDDFLSKKCFEKGVYDDNKMANSYYDNKTNNVVLISLINPSNPLYGPYKSLHEKN